MTDRIDLLRVFAEVAEQASFAGAARRLNRTPTAVTRAVAALERQLGTRLLNRTTRSVALTEAGQGYLGIARGVLDAYAGIEAFEPEGRAAPRGVLRLTAPAHFGRLHVAPLLADFLMAHPGLDARLLLVDRVVSLVEEGLDAGVRLGALPDSSLRAVRVGTLRRGVYASPAYLARRGRPESLDDLQDHDAVTCLAIAVAADQWTFDGAGRARTVRVRARLTVNTTDAAAEAAAAGLGLTRLVSYQVAPLVAEGRLVEVDLGVPEIARPIHVVHPAGAFTPAKVRLFIDEVGAALRGRFGEPPRR